MKKTNKLLWLLISVLMLASLFTLCAFAEEDGLPMTGYCYTSDPGKQSWIKWTLDDENGEIVVRFEIDKNATDKEQTTIVTAFSEEGGTVNYLKTPWYYNAKVNKMVFGEGITGAGQDVARRYFALTTVEVSKDFTTVGYTAFSGCTKLNTVHVTGTEFVKGQCDMTHMESLGTGAFDTVNFESLIVGNKLKALPYTGFQAIEIIELVIPENIGALGTGCFGNNQFLEKVTIENGSLTIDDTMFRTCPVLFTVVGYKNSTAQKFAKDNGLEFVDIQTGEVVIEGTKEIIYNANHMMAKWKIENADKSARIYNEYNGTITVDSIWGWFEEEKTLVFWSNRSGWCETGAPHAKTDVDYYYTDYKDVAEKVVIGGGYSAITGNGFLSGFTALKEVAMAGGIKKFGNNAFRDCTSLTTIYVMGRERIEGMADLSDVTSVYEYESMILKNTAIETVKVNSEAKGFNDIAFIGCKNILAKPTDVLIEYAKENGFNLINIDNPDEVYEYYRYVNPNTMATGAGSLGSFDEETGTLTIFGSGALYDTVNYYGGGAKNSPWFSIKNKIKKIVIGPKITYIGTYAFCQCVNLEVVELPNSNIEIAANAFEKCYNLKSIYISGETPIEGTFDLRSTTFIDAWTFAYDYLVVNVVLNDETIMVADSAFEDCMNLRNYYGSAGSYVETLAEDADLEFVDFTSAKPEAATATPPELNEDEKQ
ncbi:MAG: leucine-rich repeat protein, partial [Clostridia bacterium]|nr:leucine-rich repeat protein [Clostridia bacterium]